MTGRMEFEREAVTEIFGDLVRQKLKEGVRIIGVSIDYGHVRVDFTDEPEEAEDLSKDIDNG